MGVNVVSALGKDLRYHSPIIIAYGEPSSKRIVILTDDVKRAKLNERELSAIIWHELCHIHNHTTDEELCDQWAITNTDEATYRSAVMLT